MSGNLYVSPPSSDGGLPESPSVKPELNESLMNKKKYRRKVFPNGTFEYNNRNTLISRHWGNTPFFTNAKPTAMLERGWVRSSDFLGPGQKGLYTEKDGEEIEGRNREARGLHTAIGGRDACALRKSPVEHLRKIGVGVGLHRIGCGEKLGHHHHLGQRQRPHHLRQR
jgi:hypothetical protein